MIGPFNDLPALRWVNESPAACPTLKRSAFLTLAKLAQVAETGIV